MIESRMISGSISSVIVERQRQDRLWGQQDHPPLVWSAILGEEFGEFMQEVNKHHFDLDKLDGARRDALVSNLRAEAVQIAAVAVAFVEALDRNGGWVR